MSNSETALFLTAFFGGGMAGVWFCFLAHRARFGHWMPWGSIGPQLLWGTIIPPMGWMTAVFWEASGDFCDVESPHTRGDSGTWTPDTSPLGMAYGVLVVFGWITLVGLVGLILRGGFNGGA